MSPNWTPRTPEQKEAVERLGDECGGVLARSQPNGAAEVLGVRRGVYSRYVVNEDGSVVIVESRPRDWRWPLGDIFRWAAVVLMFVITILLLALSRSGVVDAGWWAAIPFLVGWTLFVVGTMVGPSPYRLRAPGERLSEWDRVRWEEH